MKRVPLLLLAFLVLPFACTPDATALTFEIAPFGGYRIGGGYDVENAPFNEVKVEPEITYGLAVGMEFDEKYHLEIMWSREETEISGSGGIFPSEQTLFGVKVDQYHLNGVYHWGTSESRIRPFVLFGLGATHLNPVPDLDGVLRFSFCLGGGVKLYLGKHLGFRFQGRWIPTYVDSDSALFCALPGSCVVVTSGEFAHQAEFTGGLILGF